MKKLKSKKHFKILTLLVFAFILLTVQFTSVLADNVNSSQSLLKSGETIDRTGFFTGENIDIAGTVNGTAFVAGNNIDITGVINGDLFVAGQNVRITGSVNGSIIGAAGDITVAGNVSNNIYSAGSNVTISSESKGSVFSVGEKITINKQAIIEKDLFAGGGQIFHHGKLGRNFLGAADNISISGIVGKNVKVSTTDLYIEAAEINGDLKYDSVNKATISNDSKIAGKTDWSKIEPPAKVSKFNLVFFRGLLFSIISLLILWLIIKLIRPHFWDSLAKNIGENKLKSLGFGSLALIVIPTAIFFLLISFVLAPLALVFASIYGIAIYISKIIVAVSLGSLIRDKFNWPDKHLGVWTTLLGLFILTALGIIPILGLIIKFIIVILGLGSIVLYLKPSKKNEII